MRTQLNVRIPDSTIRQIGQLIATSGYESQSHVIISAVERLFLQEITMSTKMTIRAFEIFTGDIVAMLTAAVSANQINRDDVVWREPKGDVIVSEPGSNGPIEYENIGTVSSILESEDPVGYFI